MRETDILPFNQFQVSHGITPSEPLVHKGGSIQFTPSIRVDAISGGIWSSDNDNIVRYISNGFFCLGSVTVSETPYSVLRDSGVATAVDLGKANIYYENAGIQTFTEVIEQISLIAVNSVLIS